MAVQDSIDPVQPTFLALHDVATEAFAPSTINSKHNFSEEGTVGYTIDGATNNTIIRVL